MKIKQGIEKAIEGGWLYLGIHEIFLDIRQREISYEHGDTRHYRTKEQALLDPDFWKAITKGTYSDYCCECHLETIGENHIVAMHEFIDHRANGKTIEESFDLATQ